MAWWTLAGSWGLAVASAAVWNLRRMPEGYGRLHVGIMLLPIAAALWGLRTAPAVIEVGPWRVDALGWMIALYVAALSAAIQRFTLRYLLGDRSYRQVFLLLTLTTGAAAFTWVSDDVRLFVLSWTLMGAGLVALVALKREWMPAKVVALTMAKVFALSALACAVAMGWLAWATGSWRLSEAMAHAAALGRGHQVGIGVLLVVAALLHAGQWPFHRWLLESAVSPTPVSAVMHAGIVNAGGLLLARSAPLLDAAGSGVAVALLTVAGLSALLGTAISLVHVDYKRQLVASTMAQMGLMLVQAALGAYEAAIAHLVLHGLFKATLFLRAGSAVPRPEERVYAPGSGRPVHPAVGALFGGLAGGAFWAEASGEPARLLSALFFGAAVALAWGQVPIYREGRWLGVAAAALMALASEGVRVTLAEGVRVALPPGTSPSPVVEGLAAVLFATGAGLLALVARRRTTGAFVRLYMTLVSLGEPRPAAMDRHPRYLAAYVKEAILR
ncbi:NADH dehydrogenase subunit 5 [Thermaerobacter marianensis]|nr:NADH dehydrogenase subunit 5 [Thermaerobacter marianensis]